MPYLPGTIRERMQDLMKYQKVTQAQLAEKIGITEGTLSRFISEKTDKIGDANIIKIAHVFNVSTDFLLGVTDEPDPKHYDLFELGLSAQAAKNLYTGKVNPRVVNHLLENDSFAQVTEMITWYFDDVKANGVIAKNQMNRTLATALSKASQKQPALKQTASHAARTILSSVEPVYKAELEDIQK